MEKREGLVTMGGNPITLIGKEIKVGDQGPDFTVLRNDLSAYSLKDAGDKIKIISVVPSLDTGVCELQTINFNQTASDLDDVIILTISVDLPFAQKRFCSANDINKVITLSDHRDLSFGMNYGFVIEELRLLSRGIVVLDRNNVVRYVEYVKEVGEQPNYDKAIEEVKKLI
ncbi:thiol peroxidase [Tissierella sp. MSJ-40]|uniref:Thiol peroxidase n=1 Tax=Tissierella simiarum TaxID=2841534 RepID=A0ABS6E6R4_9FIRM|nr:thiol peroxidase [Tissierella simiarum]MBU5437918.1 thiol peroxidase [Tissierella simiarum]